MVTTSSLFRFLLKLIATYLVSMFGAFGVTYCFMLASGTALQVALGQTGIPAIGLVSVCVLYLVWEREISNFFDAVAGSIN